jgi:hypothetical protein
MTLPGAILGGRTDQHPEGLQQHRRIAAIKHSKGSCRVGSRDELGQSSQLAWVCSCSTAGTITAAAAQQQLDCPAQGGSQFVAVAVTAAAAVAPAADGLSSLGLSYPSASQ